MKTLAVLAWLLALSTYCCFLANATEHHGRSGYATRSQRTITLHPSGASFEIPAKWLSWYLDFHNNLHLDGKGLDSVRVGQGEWDTEYAKVVNAVLPFHDCAAHVGGEGWGKNGVSWADVQLRAYQSSLTAEQVHQSLSVAGLRTARKIAKDATLLPLAIEGPWARTTITYSVSYGDYGGVARIDFYARRDKDQTIIFVFMYCDTNRYGAMDQVSSILKSFQLQH
jgi:hypothetical protein